MLALLPEQIASGLAELEGKKKNFYEISGLIDSLEKKRTISTAENQESRPRSVTCSRVSDGQLTAQCETTHPDNIAIASACFQDPKAGSRK